MLFFVFSFVSTVSVPTSASTSGNPFTATKFYLLLLFSNLSLHENAEKDGRTVRGVEKEDLVRFSD